MNIEAVPIVCFLKDFSLQFKKGSQGSLRPRGRNEKNHQA